MKDLAIQLTDGNSDNIDLKIDVVRDTEGLITQGLVVGNTLHQNQAILLIVNPGELKFNPTIGVAIGDLLLDDDYLRYRHRIREDFTKDGMKVKSIELSKDKTLKIDAGYE
ncbi:hypothetical protein [Flavobacterium sp. N1994]|uniref:hypothetical protein n=1 Tax=Flavobacterium sp. N1994 TaxID=2986827 RepID=UPI002223ED3A|nr:hypothetical protein [Flavobacterium sp. N1994]